MNKTDIIRFVGPELQEVSYIWALGYRAARRGVLMTDNPYALDRGAYELREAWRSGYECWIEEVSKAKPLWCYKRIPEPARGLVV